MSEPPLSEALRQLLHDLPATIPLERLDQIWLFGPRDLGGKESGLVVLSLLEEAGEDRGQRQVVTLSYEAEQARGALRRTDTLAQQGWAPAERVPRVIQGVLARLRDEAEDPLSEDIQGSPQRWTAFLERLGIGAG